MRRPFLLGLWAAALIPACVFGQVDSSRIRAARIVRLDTNVVRFQRPVSRVVLETAWAAADTQPTQASTAVIPRPRWSSQAVMYRKVARVRPGVQPERIQVVARRIPPRTARPTTADDDSTISRQRAADFRVRAEAVA